MSLALLLWAFNRSNGVKVTTNDGNDTTTIISSKEFIVAPPALSKGPYHLELIHIPKCAGTALEIAAARANISWALCHFQNRIDAYDGTIFVDCPSEEAKRAVDWSEGLPLPVHLRKSMFAQWHVPSYYYDALDFEHDDGVLSNPYYFSNTSTAAQEEDSRTILFAVIRNPYDRIISEYNMRAEFGALGPQHNHNIASHTKEGGLHNQVQLNQWIQQVLQPLNESPNATTRNVNIATQKKLKSQQQDNGDDETVLMHNNNSTRSTWPDASFYNLDGHLIPQSHFIYNGNQRIVHCLLHFDNLANSFEVLMNWFQLDSQIKLPPFGSEKIRRAQHKHLTRKDLTKKTRDMIQKVYADDFELVEPFEESGNTRAMQPHCEFDTD